MFTQSNSGSGFKASNRQSGETVIHVPSMNAKNTTKTTQRVRHKAGADADIASPAPPDNGHLSVSIVSGSHTSASQAAMDRFWSLFTERIAGRS